MCVLSSITAFQPMLNDEQTSLGFCLEHCDLGFCIHCTVCENSRLCDANRLEIRRLNRGLMVVCMDSSLFGEAWGGG